MTKRGYAVLRYDDRGVESSTGDFQAAKTGSPKDYMWIDTTFDVDAMKTIADWLDNLPQV